MLETAIVVPQRLRRFFPDLNRCYPDFDNAGRLDESNGYATLDARSAGFEENDNENDRFIAHSGGRGAYPCRLVRDRGTAAAGTDQSGRILSQQTYSRDRRICSRRRQRYFRASRRSAPLRAAWPTGGD